MWYDSLVMSTLTSRGNPAPRSPAVPGYADWRAALADAVTDAAELCRALGLPSSTAAAAERAARRFPLLVPRAYLARIRPGDPCDPLLLEVLPREEELHQMPQFTTDPLREAEATQAYGLLSKYRSRSLILTTAACGVHCRFCFRRHVRCRLLPGAMGDWRPAVERIAAEGSIREVILSGGDPLTVDDSRLARLARRLADVPHLRRLRVHTRLPIVVPQRVTEELLAWLRGTRLTAVLVLHVNHPAEIDTPVAVALGRLVDAGVPVLGQSVLLRGVNDRVDVLAELCERLVDLRVMPYYLHQLDRVAGAAQFEVPEATGVELLRQLRARLPGYAVPRYVQEVPGRPNKVVLG